MPKAKAEAKRRPSAKAKASAKPKASGKHAGKTAAVNTPEDSQRPRDHVPVARVDEIPKVPEESDPAAPAQKRRRTKSELARNTESKGEQPPEVMESEEERVKATVENTKVSEHSGKPQDAAETGGQAEDDSKKGKKRPRAGEASSFARRNAPATEGGRLKWNGLREAFGSVVKPHLVHYSAEEDSLGVRCFWDVGFKLFRSWHKRIKVS